MSTRRRLGDRANLQPVDRLPAPARHPAQNRASLRPAPAPAPVEAPPQDTAGGSVSYIVDRHLAWAILGHWLRDPDLSARSPPRLWQIGALSLTLGGLIGLAVASTEVAHLFLATLLSVPFLCVVLLRLAAVREVLLRSDAASAAVSAVASETLPLYSILVPLYREAAVLPRLIRALGALDYPDERLDILLVLEAADTATVRAVSSIRLPNHFRVLVVPDSQPRTKPKALNYALGQARGELLVVYDAEDVPEPDQLRLAASAFAAAGPELVCLQARLNVDDARRSLVSRQFALEYTALFDALLPALERLGLPLPLGGTSNHFRTAALRAAGAWDPFNVTEDADLGIRLARLGYTIGTLPSTTWEESPPDLGNWWRQRTRWLKGWMQTYLVHTRRPLRLYRELGAWRHLGLHVLMGAMLLSVLAYPFGLALLGLAIWNGRFLADPASDLERWLWWTSAANVGLGFATAMLLAALAARRRGWRWLAPWTLAMPLYWLFISAAGYRALWQLARQPYLWEKTRHTGGEE